MYGRGKKLSKPKTQNKTNTIRNPFTLKKKKKEIIARIIKVKTIRVIWTLFETEEKKPKEIREKKDINDRFIKD